MTSIPYPSDLTDREWHILAPLLPPVKPDGRPRTVNLRTILYGLCCKKSRRHTRSIPARLLMRLGGQSKRTGNEPGLLPVVSFVHPLHLPFPQHVHPFVALQGSPGRLKREEAQPWFDESLDEPMILFDNIVEVFHMA